MVAQLREQRLHGEADALLFRIDGEHLRFHVFPFLEEIGDAEHARVGDFADVHHAVDARLQLHERADFVEHAHHRAAHDVSLLVLQRRADPGIGHQVAKRKADFAAFLAKRLPREKLTEKRIEQLYTNYGPGKYSLPDQGYIARVHPLELWLLAYLKEFDKATFTDAVTASRDERQEVYSWLFKTRHRSARDSRIRTMLEVEAFLDIHQRWARLGYPFDHLVPSLATALGSSGDRPAALAELMGIIQNGGMRAPTLRIEHLSFAKDTPFATVFEPANTQGVRVMPAEVANALRNALSKVVEGGTARRIAGAFALQDGTVLSLGGKTGTGDNRIETVGRYGNVTSSLARNRTATFVFYIGDDHFGTLTAYVPGSQSDKFRFTSALPVQVLKGMAPLLVPYLQPGTHTQCLPGS